MKRAIGVPGDHIRLVNKQLILNGHPVDEPYVKHSTTYIDSLPRQLSLGPPMRRCPRAPRICWTTTWSTAKLVVPPGFIFAMGDNRDDSADSRYWGFVPRENIEGTPLVIYWSFEAPTADLTNGNIGSTTSST